MNPRISNKRYTRKFIKLISSFGEFWAVKAVFKDYFFSTVFLMGKTNEKLDFLCIVASTLKSWLTCQFVLRYAKYSFRNKCLIRRGSNRSIS